MCVGPIPRFKLIRSDNCCSLRSEDHVIKANAELSGNFCLAGKLIMRVSIIQTQNHFVELSLGWRRSSSSDPFNALDIPG